MAPDWPPASSDIDQLAELNIPVGGTHPLWAFWLIMEAGDPAVTVRTHNAGHRFVGGHMSGGFSPNDPVFWMHHANVDRLWARWQDNRLADVPGSTPQDHWPDPAEESPFHGAPAPPGHQLNDSMWPWVGNAAGYQTVGVSLAIRNRLPDFSGDPAVRVAHVLELQAMDVSYAAPAPGP